MALSVFNQNNEKRAMGAGHHITQRPRPATHKSAERRPQNVMAASHFQTLDGHPGEVLYLAGQLLLNVRSPWVELELVA